VEDISFAEDGIVVSVHRKKACASRSNQKIWVCNSFFGWDLLGNLKSYLSIIPTSGPLWRAIPPNPKEVCFSRPLAASTVDAVASKMATILNLPNPSLFHSHSLRRTGATLLALAGRSEEDIMAMGNWSSSSAAKRYIGESMLTKRKNGEAISIPGYIKPKMLESGPVSHPVNQKTGPVVPLKLPDPVEEPLPAKKSRIETVSFTGEIHQVIVVSSLESVLPMVKK